MRLGIIGKISQQEAEVHVKDFMLRHSKILGLNNPNDLRLLEQLKIKETERLAQMSQRRLKR